MNREVKVMERVHMEAMELEGKVVKAFLEGLKGQYTRLLGPPFEMLHSCPLQYLSWKVTFIIAITSFRNKSAHPARAFLPNTSG